VMETSNIKLNPQFESLDDPQMIVDHVNGLLKGGKAVPHKILLQKLVGQITPIDFGKLVKEDGGGDVTNAKYQILAVRQIMEFAKRNKWGLCKNQGFTYLYNGAYWKNIDADDIEDFLGKAAGKLGVPWDKAEHFAWRKELYKQFLSSAHLPAPERGKNTVLVNLENGTLEIDIATKELSLRDFDSSDFLTFQLPFRYDYEAPCPIFQKYLEEILPDPESQRALSEFLGYVFIDTSILKLEKALLLYGTGANGKSVFYDVVRKLLGDHNTSEYSLESLTNNSGYQRAMIANRLVNYASEINGKLESSVFKQLVSGEPVEARLPYQNPQIITQYAKLIFNCNELPKEVEKTHAFFRRFQIIPFDVTVPDEKQDKELANKIIGSELSGVLNWLLEGLGTLLENKRFSPCKAAEDALEQYKKESDSVRLFLEMNNYQTDHNSYVLVAEMYADYRTWTKENGFFPVTSLRFVKRMRVAKVTIKKTNRGNVAYLIKSTVP